MFDFDNLYGYGADLTRITKVNDTARGDGFHVSYCFSTRDYGCETTAVVAGNHQRFYVLNGDHTVQMTGDSFKTGTLTCSFAECLAYLHAHADQLSRFSEPLPPPGSSIEHALRVGWNVNEDGTLYFVSE
jgi:hypothetical protein